MTAFVLAVGYITTVPVILLKIADALFETGFAFRDKYSMCTFTMPLYCFNVVLVVGLVDFALGARLA